MYKIGELHFRLLVRMDFHVKAKNERFTAASSRCRQNISRRRLPDYVKTLHQKACRTIIFLHSWTNQIIDLWCCRWHCRRQILNSLLSGHCCNLVSRVLSLLERTLGTRLALLRCANRELTQWWRRQRGHKSAYLMSKNNYFYTHRTPRMFIFIFIFIYELNVLYENSNVKWAPWRTSAHCGKGENATFVSKFLICSYQFNV